MTEPLVVAFDIESRGSNMVKHGMLAIGVFAAFPSDPTRTVLLQKTWKVAPLITTTMPYGQRYEPRCLREFWFTPENKPIMEELERNALPADQAMHSFRRTLDALEREHGELFLVSDNPAFDAGWINYYLNASGLPGMQTCADGVSYRFVHDAKSYARGLFRYPITEQRIRAAEIYKRTETEPFKAERPHWPEEDARGIWHEFAATCDEAGWV